MIYEHASIITIFMVGPIWNTINPVFNFPFIADSAVLIRTLIFQVVIEIITDCISMVFEEKLGNKTLYVGHKYGRKYMIASLGYFLLVFTYSLSYATSIPTSSICSGDDPCMCPEYISELHTCPL